MSDTSVGGRRTARFVTTTPILTFYSIQSARYAQRHRRHGAVDLTVYHDPQHGRNVDRMLSAFGGVIEELPLDRVEDQQYIHYRKGSVVLYRLKDVLGEARVDAALKRFLDRFKFKTAPYPRSLDLITEFRKGATPSENALISDLFDRITLYDVKTRSVAVTKLPDGHYRTVLTVEAHKFHADGKGKETEAPLDEPIDYGVFAAMPCRGALATRDVLSLRRARVHTRT